MFFLLRIIKKFHCSDSPQEDFQKKSRAVLKREDLKFKNPYDNLVFSSKKILLKERAFILIHGNIANLNGWRYW